MDAHIGRVVLPIGRMQAGNSITPLGTCFAVGPRKFATAAHVTGPSDDGLLAIIGRADSLSDYQDTTDISINGIALRLSQYSPLHDVAILEFVDPGNTVSFGYELGGTDELMVGTPVVSLGYPHADHGRLVLTQQASMVGARILLDGGGMKIKHAVLNTQTRPGQSGGPVFTADGMRVCGTVTGHYAPAETRGIISMGGIDPQTLHQTTHIVSSEYILGLL